MEPSHRRLRIKPFLVVAATSILVALAFSVFGRECDYFRVTIVNARSENPEEVRLLLNDEEVWRGSIPAGESRSPAITDRPEGEFQLLVRPRGRIASSGYVTPLAGYRYTFTVRREAIEFESWRGANANSGVLAPVHWLEWMVVLLTDQLACADHSAYGHEYEPLG